jgi:TonB family protein
MNAYLNYILEANIGLIVILVCYQLLLSKETRFQLMRALLLMGIFASLAFPLIHINTSEEPSPLSIGTVIPSYWLPEVVVGDEIAEAPASGAREFWTYASTAYWIGIGVVAIVVLIQLLQLMRIIRGSQTYRLRRLRIAESAEDRSTFSFFNFIFIGNAPQLSCAEKQQIIRHESVHARQWHSFDVLLMNVLSVIFWFNPFLRFYKKIFIQLHEFEADARTVENSDVDKYCSLLARVALKSADLTLANYFHNSLTVKRIEMMRTIKTQMKRWKFVALAAVLPSMFFFVACQDQVEGEISEIARNATHALIAPAFIRERFEQLKKQNPEKNYALLELSETGSEKLDALQAQYGLPKSVEVFKTVNGKAATQTPLKARAETVNGDLVFEVPDSNDSRPGRTTESANIRSQSSEGSEIIERQAKPRQQFRHDGEQVFVILEFNDQTSKLSEASQQDKIYTVVQEQPQYSGGYDPMMDFIRNNLRYPLSARQQGIEGTVYISFIVEKDGSVTEVHTIRGIQPEADAEAARVVQLFPNWIPGKQNHEVVRVRFVLPIKFSLGFKTEKPQGTIVERPATD